MKDLYTEIRPYRTQQILVDDVHTLYLEEVGNPEGTPALFLHGGPSAGCEPYRRRFFDPERYRAVLFDQRGAGRLANGSSWLTPDQANCSFCPAVTVLLMPAGHVRF